MVAAKEPNLKSARLFLWPQIGGSLAPSHFESVFHFMDAIDAAHGLLSHLLMKVAADHSLQDNPPLAVLNL